MTDDRMAADLDNYFQRYATEQGTSVWKNHVGYYVKTPLGHPIADNTDGRVVYFQIAQIAWVFAAGFMRGREAQ